MIRKILKISIFFTVASWIAATVSSCGYGNSADKDLQLEIDSLNRVSYNLRYKNLILSSGAANRAFNLAKDISYGKDVSLNNMGFCAFMRMDFEQSMILFKKVVEISDNELECLVADIGLMKICQRISSNKEFYDYRNRAMKRIRRILQDGMVLEDSSFRDRFNYALSEFHIVSGVYFYYLQQDKESMAEIDAVDVSTIENDTAQWLNYMYMRGSGGMYTASSKEELILGEFGFLVKCLTVAEEGGYVYFQANALQAMAETLNFRSNRSLIMDKKKAWIQMVNENNCPLDSLPLELAQKALKLFKRYGDWYQISGTYRTMATYYNYIDEPEKALPLLGMALEFVNRHHEKYYECNDSTDRMSTYKEDSQLSVELEWINNDGIMTVPEWIARLREQLSRTFSAMGMKEQSDYNRNMYLDILDYTRQDKELESRYDALGRESSLLNVLLVLVMAGFFVLVILFVNLNRIWKKRNNIYTGRLKKVLEVCRNITASVPLDVSEPYEVAKAVEDVVRIDILSITSSEDLWIELKGEDSDILHSDDRPQWIDGKCVFSLALVAPARTDAIGTLWLKRNSSLKNDDMSFLQLVMPYMAWTLENGLNIMALTDERLRLEHEEYIHRQHIAENKRQNEVKKACMAIVTGILPYIDRVINEVEKLKNCSVSEMDEVSRFKLDYIDELLSKINDYNDILTLWIKMKRGDISLNIENFSLGELFAVIMKGRRSFDMKNIELVVENTESVVKADKALTLFMINTLSENARKYTDRGGRVSISSSETDEYVEISVEDNGPGLSPCDVECILSEKVYDSGLIGIDTASDTEELKKKKGHGFGLMNCKGIIEKYRKTNPIFNVCKFGIDSEVGKGSRFYFRLPKGVRRMLVMLCVMVSALHSWGRTDIPLPKVYEEPMHISSYDSLLSIANRYADMVYYSNVKSEYKRALGLADSAFYYLNLHYIKYSGMKKPLLRTYGSGMAPELVWLNHRFDTDYYIILDVRNEVAVASLAIKDFHRYYFNNAAYTSLYKQISEDKSLEKYCMEMQNSSGNKIVAIAIFILLILGGIVAYYMLYLRHMLHYRFSMEQVLAINRSVFSSSRISGVSDRSEDICKEMIDLVFSDINELVSVSNMAIGVYEDSDKKIHMAFHSLQDDSQVADKIHRAYNGRRVLVEDEWVFIPLKVEISGETKYIGVMALCCEISSVREEDRLMVELVSEYLAVALYKTIVQTEKHYQDIEIARDDTKRSEYEDNMLHVQNMVLDNCLSTIKHETVYYPGQLRKLVALIRSNYNDDALTNDRIKDMSELVSYYRDIFSLLSSCASRQIDDVTFRRSSIRVSVLTDHAMKYYRKSVKKLDLYPELEIEQTADLTVTGDEILLKYMFENLVDEAVRYHAEGKIKIKVDREGDFVRFDFVDKRRHFPQCELDMLFYPDNAHIRVSDDGDVLSGTEYLLCKQIIRDHDEFGGRRGCRINASVVDENDGFVVWFTLPLKKVL